MPPQAQPELDASPILDIEGHRVYQQLVGIAHWLITCGRFDLCYAILSLSQFSACPREGHLKALEQVFRYLNKNQTIAVRIDPSNFTPPAHVNLTTVPKFWCANLQNYRHKCLALRHRKWVSTLMRPWSNGRSWV